MSTTKPIPPTSIDLHSLAILATGIASAIAMVLIALSYFDVPLILGTTALLCMATLHVCNVQIYMPRLSLENQERRFIFIVLAIIVVALLARIDIYPHLMGGQDQGLYTNMSKMLLHDKSLFFVDPLRNMLSEELKHIYDLSPLAGVTLVNPEKSLLSVVFYPLHPAWMAISGFLLGEGNHTLSLLMFSIFYLAGGYFLTREVFENRHAALLAMAFLAINPALAFFSKFPASEMVAFAFTINGYLFLLRGWRAKPPRQQTLFLLISFLCFNALLYTRPQFIMHIPFMAALGVACLLPLWAVRQRIMIAGYLLSLLLAFAVSIIFYYFYQNLLFTTIMNHLNLMAKPQILVAIAAAGVALGVLVVLVVWRKPKGTRPGDHLAYQVSIITQRFAPWAIPCALLLSIPSIIALYQTGILHPFLFFSAISPDQDPWIIRYHVLYRLMLLISPLGLLLLCITPLSNLRWNGATQLFVIFFSLAWMVVLLQPSIPYLYYYGRYLSGEMVPISLILCAAILVSFITNHKKWYALAGIGIMLTYFSIYTALQYGKQEDEAPAFAQEIAKAVSDNDILFTIAMNSVPLTPLRLYYGVKVFLYSQSRADMPHEEQVIEQLHEMTKKMGGKLYYISPTPAEEGGVHLVKKLVFSNSFFTNGEHLHRNGIHNTMHSSNMFLPTRHRTNTSEWYLYEISGQSYASGHCLRNNDFSQIIGKSVLIDGFSTAEGHGRWSDGPKAYFECTLNPDEPAPKRMVLFAHAMVTKLHSQRVRFSLNGAPMQEFMFTIDNNDQEITLPVEAHPGDKLRLDFDFPDAVMPKDLGINADTRLLGLGVKSIRLE